ncbi:hypothetical protein BBF96_14825 [Anoxybacter fermentans]|uniref:Cobyrinate a,c-diamide synthase n=1 Tax=Anoxybacter fermentans TaxID=1323375 RepID=A0A3S9T1W1_9FIRM|nr:cobyrinate a,c-diamide synthase [Anoxybacter fermentans]AZR74548.1 hypothetical protein BBF96_14825 [Anoxybacter fermentans]
MNLPRLVIAGTQSGVGKTTITLGIMAALSRRGFKVAPYKVGPDYIDPGFHTFVTNTKSRNLDLWLLTEEKVKYLFQKNSRDFEISIIEGVMGLYDGVGTKKDKASTAHLAKVLKAPLVLVIDGSGISASAAAQVLGYQLYDRNIDFKGVIVNKVSGEAHYQLIKEAIERDTGIKCFGYLPKTAQIELKSRHLGLVPGMEVKELKSQIDKLIKLVEDFINLEGLMELGKKAPQLKIQKESEEIRQLKIKARDISSVKIGIAYDKAFNFYYQDNLDLLKELGAELVYFSPLYDSKLPSDLDGLYIGGGFPEVFGAELEENKSMRQSIAWAIKNRMPVYAECGGLMYLTREIKTLNNQSYQMVGAILTASIVTERLQRFGYVEIKMGKNLFNVQGCVIPAHEFHYSKLQDDSKLPYTYQIRKKTKNWQCGVGTENLLAGYPHLHFYSYPRLALEFILRCWEYRIRRNH